MDVVVVEVVVVVVLLVVDVEVVVEVVVVGSSVVVVAFLGCKLSDRKTILVKLQPDSFCSCSLWFCWWPGNGKLRRPASWPCPCKVL